jgi:hypothetical protein
MVEGWNSEQELYGIYTYEIANLWKPVQTAATSGVKRTQPLSTIRAPLQQMITHLVIGDHRDSKAFLRPGLC